MTRQDADRNLLFGINALQNDFITRDALISGMAAWALEKHRSLGDILVEKDALDPGDRALLDQLIDRHVARHGGDSAASLAAMSSIGSVADDLRRKVADPDVLKSIANIHPGSQLDPYATRATIPPEQPSTGVRFRKVREHASGNLGVVYVARDEELNREVALKEIKERNADHSYSQAKFLLEAEVTGGLEHPGIVPVYGLGHHDDGRPFYAMRFIRGKSLLEAIRRFHADDSLKSDPGARLLALQKLVRRFTDVCNAVAYAHSRGVLHRDLKPDNVMVGKYGETLVVDWGLAKALGTSGEESRTVAGPDDPLPEALLQPSSAEGFEATQAGSLVGTPAYMSPEQAAGRLDLLGPASDIYGLGATLYHLIVGCPPISGTSLGDLLAKIQSGEFPRPRSLVSWLDPALEAICLKAMAMKPEARYATPRALADDLDRWIANEPVAAYPEPFTRRAQRWTRRHKTALATAASAAFVAALLLGGVARLRASERQRVDASALAAMGRAESLAIQARTARDPDRWEAAVAEAVRAGDRLESGGGSPPLRLEVADRLEALRAEQDRLRRALDDEDLDRRTVAALEEARLRGATLKDGDFDLKAVLEGYLNAFRRRGIDVATLPVEEAARRIKASLIADDLIATLDDWAHIRGANVPPARLEAISRAAETDPGRAAIREARARQDNAALRRLCDGAEARRKLGPHFRLAFDSLRSLDASGNLPLLEAILREHPGDFWLNFNLGVAYEYARPRRSQDAVRRLSAAVALRPDGLAALINLARSLQGLGQVAEAVATYAEAVRLRPDAWSHYDLGKALYEQGKFDLAVAEHRESIRLKPDHADAHYHLADALKRLDRPDEAIAEFREAIRLKPDYADAHNYIGVIYQDRGELDRALAEFLEAIRLKPDYGSPRHNMGLVLTTLKRPDEAIAAYRESVRIRPEFAGSHLDLGRLLARRGKFRESLESLERGHSLNLKHSGGNRSAEGWVLEARRLVELEAKLPAILKGEVAPKDVEERLALVDFCYKAGHQAAAARFADEAFAGRPDLADDLAKYYRYNAACSAALAASGPTRDDPAPDEAARSGLRAKALGWLRDDLATLSRPLEAGPGDGPARSKTVLEHLALWKDDPDLAGIRDEESLAKLPEAERVAFRSLWADVDALRKKAESVGPK